MIKRYFLIFLIYLAPALCNSQDLGRCSRDDISIVEKFRACKAIVTDLQYTKNQQARAAIIAGLLNRIDKGSAHETIGLFLLAVDRGDLSGYAHIGDTYREGDGKVAKDFEKALDYYYRDTSHSYVKASGLALLNLYGQGVEQNSLKAIFLTYMAFKQSRSSLMANRICDIYSVDKYGVQDIAKAHMWCSISVKVEQHPMLKSSFEDQRIKLAAKLSASELKRSNDLLNKCVSADYFDCDLPVNLK